MMPSRTNSSPAELTIMPLFFIEVSASRMEIELSCICVLLVSKKLHELLRRCIFVVFNLFRILSWMKLLFQTLTWFMKYIFFI